MFYLFDAVVPSMIERKSGRFAGIASIAGLRGLPSASVYSASKAAMQNFLEASRVELAHAGVGVTIVNPGWVDTPIIEKYKGAGSVPRLRAEGGAHHRQRNRAREAGRSSSRCRCRS